MPSESVPSEQPVLLRDEALERFDQDDDLLREVFRHFVGEAPDRLRRIRSHFASGETEALRKEVHSLKGVAANLSAKRLAAACLLLEPILQAGKLPLSLEPIESELAELLLQLEVECEA